MTKSKNMKTVYWGITVDTQTVLDKVNDVLINNKQLIPLKQMHTTLLFVGRKNDDRENQLLPHKDKQCRIVVSGHAIDAEKALALKVKSINFMDNELQNEVVPAFPSVLQHITVALANGVKAVDSVNAFVKGVSVDYEEELVIYGQIKQYFF